jgi:hypothetical protein
MRVLAPKMHGRGTQAGKHEVSSVLCSDEQSQAWVLQDDAARLRVDEPMHSLTTATFFNGPPHGTAMHLSMFSQSV